MKSDKNLQTARNPAEFLEILRSERNEVINAFPENQILYAKAWLST